MKAKTHEGDGYWLPRQTERYYAKVREWLNQFSPGGSILDVGGHDTPVATWGDFDSRSIVNKSWVGREPDDCAMIREHTGLEHIVARFYTNSPFA